MDNKTSEKFFTILNEFSFLKRLDDLDKCDKELDKEIIQTYDIINSSKST